MTLRADDLIALLTEQRELYRQLTKLSEAQHGLITSEAPERLLDVLGKRQTLLERLETLAEQIRPYLQDWAAFRGAMNAGEGSVLDSLVGEVNGLLSRIIEQDQADAQLLAARKSETGNSVATLNQGRRAGAAYVANAYAATPQGEWTDE